MADPLHPDGMDRDHPVGEGKTSVVYLQPDGSLYKEYRRGPVAGAHLDRLIGWRARQQPADLAYLDAHCAWPLRRVGIGAATYGYLMNQAPSDFWAYAGDKRQVVELGSLISPPDDPAPLLPVQSRDRLRLVRSLAALLQFFARHDLVHGDISDTNVLWTVRDRPHVYLIDCDDVRLGAVAVPADYMAVPQGEWLDPELSLQDPPDANSDRRALALVCYRAFYGATAPATAAALPKGPVQLPNVAFLTLEGLRRRDRPTATQWFTVLDEAVHALPEPPRSAARPGPRLRGNGPAPRADAPAEQYAEPLAGSPSKPGIAAVQRAAAAVDRRRPQLWLVAGAAVVFTLLGLGSAAVLDGGPSSATPALPVVLPVPSDTRLERAEEQWAEGDIKIEVRGYFAAIGDLQGTGVVTGWVNLRIVITNKGTAPLNLAAGPDRLVLLMTVDPRGFSAPEVAREDSFDTPDRLRLHTVGFKARREGLSYDGQPYDAGWDATSLPPSRSFNAHNMGKDSAVYLVPPPKGLAAGAAGPLDPRAMDIIGVAWVEGATVLGFTPVSAWEGSNTFESFKR